MGTIYDLSGEWKSVYDMADDPEMDEESWLGMMEAIEGDLTSKAEGYARVDKNLEAYEESLAAEEKRIAAKRKIIADKRANLKTRFKQNMEYMGRDSISAGVFVWKIQKNGGKLPLIINEGASVYEVDTKYITMPEPVFNNEAIREALDSGEELPFAHYGERGTSLRLK